MHAMQYEITLPADYDMEIIRHRVATKGPSLDAFPGLGLKAYGIRERGIDGSPVNQYSPFYLWHSLAGMNSFLWGDGFRGIIESFGRPPVQHWTGIAYQDGPARAALPRTSSRRTQPIPAGSDPATVIERALDDLRQRSSTAGVHSAALAIDTRGWELVHFTLWQDSAPESEIRYQVLHLSTPQLSELERGQHW